MSERKIDRLKLAKIEDPRKRIPLLNSVALASPRSETSYAIALLREALSLCSLVDIPVFFAQTHLNLSRWLGNGAFFQEAFKHLSASEKLFRKLKDTDALRDVDLVHALITFEKGDFHEAFLFAERVYTERKILQQPGNTELVLVSSDRLSGEPVSHEKSVSNNELKLAIATRILAMVEASRMDYFKALNYIDANFELWQRLGQNQELATSLKNAGVIYAGIHDYHHADEFFKRALEIYRSSDAKGEIISVLSHLAGIHIDRGEFEKALHELNEGLQITQDLGYAPSEVEISLQFGRYYIQTNDLPEAFAWASRALTAAAPRGMRSSMSPPYALIGEILYRMSRYEEAIEMLLKSLEFAKGLAQMAIKVRCFEYLYLSHKALNNLTEAFSFLEKYQALESELLEIQKRSNAEAIQHRFITRLAETTEAVSEAENKELAEEVEKLTEELTGLIRKVRKQDEVLGKLKKGTSSLVNYSKEAQDILKPIFHEIKEGIDDLDENKEIEQKLQIVQRHFMKALERKYPSLTKAESRICALIHTEMSSIEIASLLNISVRTVENHRMHIRQKLHVDGNASLLKVLNNIS